MRQNMLKRERYGLEDPTQTAVLYARVSTKEQRKEGYSIEAQLELIRSYANNNRIRVLAEFVDIDSASKMGRTKFGEMLAFLETNPKRCSTILVEKTDRLYRNMMDYSRIEESRVTVHFVKTGRKIGPDSKSAENFVHGMEVVSARNQSQNLGEEALKGMIQKARQGLYPSAAPAGYRNVEGENRKRIIVPSPDAPTITWLFEEFSSGRYVLKGLSAAARSAGWNIRGKPLSNSTVHQILRRRIYMGDFDFNGETYQGTHQPLVTKEIWDRVQALLDKRNKTNRHRIKHDFAYSGFVRCGHCGCQMVGEIKKGKYVYYHCTGYRGKCPERYTREAQLEDQLVAAIRQLTIPPGVLGWLSEVVNASDLTERAARERETTRVEEMLRKNKSKAEMLYEDRLESRITVETFERKARDLDKEAADLQSRLSQLRFGAPAPLAEAIDLMDLTSRAAELFALQPAQEKQQFLSLVLKSACWSNERLTTEFESPFEEMRLSNQLTQSKDKENGASMTQNEIWLPVTDSNHGRQNPSMAYSKSTVAPEELTIENEGAQLFKALLSAAQLSALESVLARQPQDQAGVRLFGIPDLGPFLKPSGAVGKIPASVLGPECLPVRAILFDKSADQNWSLGWHQDRTIAVRQRIDVEGFGPWSTKSDMLHVEPPFDLLDRMVTVRFHLDPVPASNAPLLVAPGSHRRGRIPTAEIPDVVSQCGVIQCLAEAGDIWLYATPILHASNAASEPRHRRVLQVDYAARELPGGMEWLGV